MFPGKVAGKAERSKEAGTSLVEVLAALAIIGIIAAVFCGGLATSARASAIINERNVGESLSLSQMEHINSEGYVDYSVVGHGTYTPVTAPAGYTVNITVTPINPETGVALGAGLDSGVQRITVTVTRGTDTLTTLSGYKVRW